MSIYVVNTVTPVFHYTCIFVLKIIIVQNRVCNNCIKITYNWGGFFREYEVFKVEYDSMLDVLSAKFVISGD
jgi:hypothetical protein